MQRTTIWLLATSCLAAACGAPEAPAAVAPEVGEAVAIEPPADDAALAYTLPRVYGPAALKDLNADPNVVEVELEAAPVDVTINGAHLSMYGFNGQIPGPLLQAKVGDRVIVHFTNHLPEPTTIHWHGVRVPDAMDGSPRVQSPIPAGGTFDYDFVVPDAGSFWYHPHVRTNEQVEKGLYGPIIVHDVDEPRFDLERYIMLDDILLSHGAMPAFLADMMEGMHGRTGNVLITNGTSDPVADASEQGRVERWHLVNTANARLMSLDLPGATWRIVGTDGGRIETPYKPRRIELAPGQRYDLEVRYDRAGTATLQSYVLVQDAQGNTSERPRPVFRVDVEASDREPTPIVWSPLTPREPRTVTDEVTLTIDAVGGGRVGITWRLNGHSMPMDPLFSFDRGATVKMHLVNRLVPYHPFHVHGQFFEVVSDGRPETAMPGLRDTVVLPGQETVDIIGYFDNPGRWMAHCHILEHAELGMMGEIVVNP